MKLLFDENLSPQLVGLLAGEFSASDFVFIRLEGYRHA
jgi:predicted nuclease of predicted toxin-antitoxin system